MEHARNTPPAGLRRFLPLAGFDRGRRTARAELDDRAELGHDVLAGKVALSKLKGAAAEPYLQGLDVLECRGLRLLEVYAVRERRAQRCLWRLSPARRATRKLPDTPAGRRQRAWLERLREAGLI